eukprot:TRINITY_DN33394_c0_g1_i1.p3 TRINITY_DN33394_c0_g1~~TRINITY_DN33394_c0_g1_i1.p3  ORF type:complete len:191 (+),score=55.99 TRINITY_DN33394_c0_g1_i1:76-648(+)
MSSPGQTPSAAPLEAEARPHPDQSELQPPSAASTAYDSEGVFAELYPMAEPQTVWVDRPRADPSPQPPPAAPGPATGSQRPEVARLRVLLRQSHEQAADRATVAGFRERRARDIDRWRWLLEDGGEDAHAYASPARSVRVCSPLATSPRSVGQLCADELAAESARLRSRIRAAEDEILTGGRACRHCGSP